MSKEALIDDTATVTTESEEFRKQATEADEKIRQSLKNLKRDWVSLGRLCEDFKKKNYHRAIIDDKTVSPSPTSDLGLSPFSASPRARSSRSSGS